MDMLIIFCTTRVIRYEIFIVPQCDKALNDFVEFFFQLHFLNRNTLKLDLDQIFLIQDT